MFTSEIDPVTPPLLAPLTLDHELLLEGELLVIEASLSETITPLALAIPYSL